MHDGQIGVIMTSTDEKRITTIFKALCDENRVKILKILIDGEKCACKLLEALNVVQPTLSHHMKILCDSGQVVSRKEGKWMHYALSREGFAKASACLEAFSSGELPESEKG